MRTKCYYGNNNEILKYVYTGPVSIKFMVLASSIKKKKICLLKISIKMRTLKTDSQCAFTNSD